MTSENQLEASRFGIDATRTDLFPLHEGCRYLLRVDLVFFRPFELDFATIASREQSGNQFEIGTELR